MGNSSGTQKQTNFLSFTLLNFHSSQSRLINFIDLQVFRAVAFLHEAGMVHGCLHAGSIFVTPERQWKLFGFERTISTSKGQGDQSPVYWYYNENYIWQKVLINEASKYLHMFFQGPLLPSLSKYAPPEAKHSSGANR